MRGLPTWIVVIAIVLIGSGLLLWHTTFSANAPIVMGGTAVPPVPMLDTNTVATGKLLYAEHGVVRFVYSKLYGSTGERKGESRKAEPMET